MKKFAIAAIMAVMSLGASAQVWIAGSVSYNHEKTGDIKKNAIVVAPEVGFELGEKWAAGLELAEVWSKAKGMEAANSFRIAPFARYTFAKVNDNLSFFADGGVSYTIVKGDDNDVFGIGVRPGMKYKMSDNWALVSKLGYIGWSKVLVDGGTSKFGLGANGEDISFGVEYTF